MMLCFVRLLDLHSLCRKLRLARTVHVQVLSGAILGVVVACFVPSPTQLPIV